MTPTDADREALRVWLDRKPPTDVHMRCPVYGDDACRYEYAKDKQNYCSGAFCLAIVRHEQCPSPFVAPYAGTWRDFERAPCPRCEGRGHIVVEVADGTFGFCMQPCPRCNVNP